MAALAASAPPAPVATFRSELFTSNVSQFRNAAQELRAWQMANDPHYPIFHFTAPEGHNNDPNGLVRDPRTGLYHRFYQWQPVAANGSTLPVAWGHTVSRDLSWWDDWPVAMFADTPWDSAGVFSGNIVFGKDGIPTALYTGNVAGHAKTYGVCARSTDGLVTWSKSVCMDASRRPNAASPVNWDTYLWREGGTYNALVGGCTDPAVGAPRGTAFLWQSSDLRSWTDLGPIWGGGPGPFWELPYLLPFDASGAPAPYETASRWALLFGYGNAYWVGAYNRTAHRFTPDHSSQGSRGGATPPPQSSDPGSYYSFNAALFDHAGRGGSLRRLMFGWVTGGRPQPFWAAQAHSLLREVRPHSLGLAPPNPIKKARARSRTRAPDQEHARPIKHTRAPARADGTLSVRLGSGYRPLSCVRPMCGQVRLAHDGVHLVQSVAPEVERLRCRLLHSVASPVRIAPNSSGHLPASAFGDVLEIRATFALPADANESPATMVGLTVRGGPADPPERLSYAPHRRDVCAGGLSGAERCAPTVEPARASAGPRKNVTLRAFVDRSISEVYCDGAAITSRLFPRHPADATAVDVFAAGSEAVWLLQLEVWSMGSMWATSAAQRAACSP